MSATLHYGWAKPDATANVDEEFYRLQATLDEIDDDLYALFGVVSGKAAAVHGHAMADITGLSAALAAKMSSDRVFALDDLSGVSGAASAPAGYLLLKTPTGWQPSSPAAALGVHQHAQSDVLGLPADLAAKANLAGNNVFTGDIDIQGALKTAGITVKRILSITTVLGVASGITTSLSPVGTSTMVANNVAPSKAGSKLAVIATTHANCTAPLGGAYVGMSSWLYYYTGTAWMSGSPGQSIASYAAGATDVQLAAPMTAIAVFDSSHLRADTGVWHVQWYISSASAGVQSKLFSSVALLVEFI